MIGLRQRRLGRFSAEAQRRRDATKIGASLLNRDLCPSRAKPMKWANSRSESEMITLQGAAARLGEMSEIQLLAGRKTAKVDAGRV